MRRKKCLHHSEKQPNIWVLVCAILESCDGTGKWHQFFFLLFLPFLTRLSDPRDPLLLQNHCHELGNKTKTEKDSLITRSVCAQILSDDCAGISPFGSLQEVRKQYGSVGMCHRSQSFSRVFFPIKDATVFHSNCKQSLAASYIYIFFCYLLRHENINSIVKRDSQFLCKAPAVSVVTVCICARARMCVSVCCSMHWLEYCSALSCLPWCAWFLCCGGGITPGISRILAAPIDGTEMTVPIM